jgi:hypothetical protein
VRGEGSLLRFLPAELFPDAERAHYPAPPPNAVRAVR